MQQVYRAVRNSVQDAAVKLLTNVDAAQLATFSQVTQYLLALRCSRSPAPCAVPFFVRASIGKLFMHPLLGFPVLAAGQFAPGV